MRFRLKLLVAIVNAFVPPQERASNRWDMGQARDKVGDSYLLVFENETSRDEGGDGTAGELPAFERRVT